jgi:hypothetical protein
MEQKSYRYEYNTQQRSNLKSKFYRTEFQKKLNNMGIKPYNLPSHYRIKNIQTKTIFIEAGPLYCGGRCVLKLSCKM